MDCDLDEGGSIGRLLQGFTPASLKHGRLGFNKETFEVALKEFYYKMLRYSILSNCALRPVWRFALQYIPRISTWQFNKCQMVIHSRHFNMVLF